MTTQVAQMCLFAAVLTARLDCSAAPPASRNADPEKRRPPDRIEDNRLTEPVLVEAGDKPLLQQSRRYALEYPFVGDIDGDGFDDLLLGDHERGRLRVFRNVGTARAPRLAAPVWFDEMVPTGNIPKG